MVAISLCEIQKDFPAYLRRVEDGESLVILDHDRPVAELKPVALPANGQRPVGLCAGEFRVRDDFDQPLPDAVAARLQTLLDRQDAGNPLNEVEKAEAEGLVNLAEFLTLLRLRAERATS
jgi:antitoxin (DNA-binding transcriptional repressor) of toxin-antitoxin stability system